MSHSMDAVRDVKGSPPRGDRLRPWLVDRHLFQATFLAAIVVYGYAITNFALHIDVEAASVYGSITHTFSLGRWGISLVHLLILPEPVAPYFTSLLSLLFLTLAALATQSVFAFEPPQRYVFSILYVSFPQFAYQLEFSNQSDCVAFGLCCASLAFVALQRFFAGGSRARRAAFLFASGALLVLATSFYESLVFVVPVLCTLSCLQRLLNGRPSLSVFVRDYGWSALLTVSAYGVCSLIAKAFQRHFRVTPSDYLVNMIGWRSHSFGDALGRVLRFIWADVSGQDFYGNVLYLAAVAAGVVIILASAWHTRGAPRSGLVAGLVAAALAAPFIIVLVLGEHQEPRTFVTEQIVFAALIAMACSLVRVWPALQMAMTATLALASCLHVSRLFFSDTMAWEADRLLGNRVVQEIYRAYPTFQERTTPVHFHGPYAPPNIWMGDTYNVFGKSFFVWDGGKDFRISGFLKASGIADLKVPTPQETLAVEPVATDMPTWPNPNAIRLIAGVVVVRMGP